MMLKIRPYEETDRLQVFHLLNQMNSTPLGEEIFELREIRTKSYFFFARIIGVDQDNRIVGMAEAYHSICKTPKGYLNVGVVVDEPMRGKGYGRLLSEALQEIIRDHKPDALLASVRDHDPISHQWAKKRGYTMKAYQFDSVMDLSVLPEGNVDAEIESVRQQGIMYCTAVDYPMEPNMEHYYKVINRLSRETPDSEGAPDMPYEMFVNIVRKLEPNAMFLAMADSGIVGVTILVPRENELYTFFTGTVKDYRGQGIARTLKLLSFRHAREKGIMRLRSSNRSINAPMLAINHELGYVSEPGEWILELPLRA